VAAERLGPVSEAEESGAVAAVRAAAAVVMDADAQDAVAFGGHLQVDSPPGAGTTLEMTLPLSEPGGPAR
jgi:hypothetical protein